ncbi:MAG: hypothetical protein QOK30_2588 [Nocardioidaceae bacterium]|jgi:hypothetical protein|nr:hypothetical protein [Nocardioidaceae bacterium]
MRRDPPLDALIRRETRVSEVSLSTAFVRKRYGTLSPS